MLPRAALLLLCAVVLGACGASEQSGVDEFSGQERQVAQVVADLAAAADDGDAAQICSALLTPQLADRLKAGARTCTQELDDALVDGDALDLTTREVAVTGTSATARVQSGEGGLRTVDLVREGTGWRIAAIRRA